MHALLLVKEVDLSKFLNQHKDGDLRIFDLIALFRQKLDHVENKESRLIFGQVLI
jgi:hypothetical protein